MSIGGSSVALLKDVPEMGAARAFLPGGIFEELQRSIDPQAQRIVLAAERAADHPVFGMVHTLADARAFMEFHVWCVWDFMSLAKAVQIAVGCYHVPWIPPQSAALVAAIDKVIADEETDRGPDGRIQSHFEIYLDAMEDAGASTLAIRRFVHLLRDRAPISEALDKSGAPKSAAEFVKTTMNFALAPAHISISAFCLGREELVPNMTRTFLRNLPREQRHLERFFWYLHRHVELDTDSHGPLTAELFRSIVGDNSLRRGEALQAAVEAISARGRYLDAIAEMLRQR
jgi:hypothetical protein